MTEQERIAELEQIMRDGGKLFPLYNFMNRAQDLPFSVLMSEVVSVVCPHTVHGCVPLSQGGRLAETADFLDFARTNCVAKVAYQIHCSGSDCDITIYCQDESDAMLLKLRFA